LTSMPRSGTYPSPSWYPPHLPPCKILRNILTT